MKAKLFFLSFVVFTVFNSNSVTANSFLTEPDSISKVEMTGFNAIMNGNWVMINWNTSAEMNNDYFTVEKSKDGVSFETVAIVKGSSSSIANVDYNETDFNPYEGISYYRLKRTDNKGKTVYSNMVPVNYRFNVNNSNLNVFPNPNSGKFNLDLTPFENKEVLVLIRNAAGQECYSKVFLKQDKEEIVAIDTEGKLVAGTYLVVGSSLNALYSCKIVIK
ncbi:MAG: T9SS type A sorting domain-containing protein [Bacteroidia bacterium]|nr:T9SS type A sorting domain-containing protein [Bacteroidia bacterium]